MPTMLILEIFKSSPHLPEPPAKTVLKRLGDRRPEALANLVWITRFSYEMAIHHPVIRLLGVAEGAQMKRRWSCNRSEAAFRSFKALAEAGDHGAAFCPW